MKNNKNNEELVVINMKMTNINNSINKNIQYLLKMLLLQIKIL